MSQKSNMNVEIVKALPSLVFHWPAGTEEYSPVIEVRGFELSYTKPSTLFIAYGYRETFGCLRRRILVFRNEADVLAEFVGLDNWAQTRRVATFLRREGTKNYLRKGDPLPSRYDAFDVVHSDSVITGRYAPRCLAAVADEADIPTLVALAIAREQGESANVRGMSTNHEAIANIDVGQGPADLKHRQAVVQALLEYRTHQHIGDPFTRDEDADKFLRGNRFAFLMAASIDRGALAEAVWQVPFLLKEKFGHLDPQSLSQMSEHELEGALRQLDKRPRFPRHSARTIASLAKLVTEKFSGDAAGIWKGREPLDVVDTLQQVWGVGPGIAHMTVRILIDEFGYHPSPRSLRTVDVKPDTHVTRVFYRTGLTTVRSRKACIEAARQLHPEFPGLLDWPTWEIGRTWCHEHNPDCATCPLCHVCLMTGTLP